MILALLDPLARLIYLLRSGHTTSKAERSVPQCHCSGSFLVFQAPSFVWVSSSFVHTVGVSKQIFCRFLSGGLFSKMARAATGLFLLGLLLVASWATTEASVTVVNSALIPVDVSADGKLVTVQTGASPVNVNVNGAKEQNVQVSTGNGKKPISVDVKDGDTIVIIPDFLGGGFVNVNVNGVFQGHL